MLHIPNVPADPEHRSRDSLWSFTVGSRPYLPVSSEGRTVGTIGLASTRANNYSELHIAVILYSPVRAGMVRRINERVTRSEKNLSVAAGRSVVPLVRRR